MTETLQPAEGRPTRVLVTGATGFIGRALVKRLATDVRFVITAAVRSGGEALPESVYRIAAPDLRGERWSRDILSGFDVVVHAAGRAHIVGRPDAEETETLRRVNVVGTAQLASDAVEAGVKRLLFLSTVKVHGETGSYTEQDEPAPSGAYAWSKYEAELELARVSEATGIETVIIRPPLVYGPGVKANFLSLMRLVRSGTPLPLGSIDNRRSLVAAGNLADFVRACLLDPAAANETFLVSDGQDLSTPQLIDGLARAMGRRARLYRLSPSVLRGAASLLGKRTAIERLTETLLVDISKARQRLGWTPPVSVAEGLRQTVAEPEW